MQKTIVLSGFKESGKSTVMSLFEKHLKERGRSSSEVMIAKKLKVTCAKAFELTYDHFELQELKEVEFDEPKKLTKEMVMFFIEEYNVSAKKQHLVLKAYNDLKDLKFKTPRMIAQKIGTELLRAASPDIHLEAAVESAPKESDFLIVTDARFLNEFSYFQSKGATCFYIVGKNFEMNYELAKQGALHESETNGLKLIKDCKLLMNVDTIESLDRNIGSLCNLIINDMI